ncbi:hypothetical protein NC653_039409 [Populus alba x Populus x berolinensis]|uniref:Uncharacterized protein n=1 Tax=Populus alba x Populus x berolinensis TaxID=444605 RepID=A0AAD6LBV3_9ROSI|nr:hypothetical protein NC653_039409 [Populus alba x Populus x berolinensis]
MPKGPFYRKTGVSKQRDCLVLCQGTNPKRNGKDTLEINGQDLLRGRPVSILWPFLHQVRISLRGSPIPRMYSDQLVLINLWSYMPPLLPRVVNNTKYITRAILFFLYKKY